MSPAAASAAGYRPCLRCRPDALPVAMADGETTSTVVRALVLIGEGFLDRYNEAELGRVVGYSARHLRRLFLTEVGATPAAVARSRRAHFARRLLDDTDLRVVDIAAAAGFTSLRQMNEVMRSTFRFSPTELRARRSPKRFSAVDGGLRVRLTSERPIGFADLLEHLIPRCVEGVESIEKGVYRRTTNVCGHAGVVEIEADDSDLELHVVLHLPAVTGLIDEVGRCRRLVGLDHRSVPEAGWWEPFEAAIRVLVEETSGSVDAAAATLSALTAQLGRPVDGVAEFGLHAEFPGPDTFTAVAGIGGGVLHAEQAAMCERVAVAHLASAGAIWQRRDHESMAAALEREAGLGSRIAGRLAHRLDPSSERIVGAVG